MDGANTGLAHGAGGHGAAWRLGVSAVVDATPGRRGVEARVCQYEASTDGYYLVDRHPELENVWLVGGGSGHGFKMGPALGEHAAAVVLGRAGVEPLFAYERLQPRPGP